MTDSAPDHFGRRLHVRLVAAAIINRLNYAAMETPISFFEHYSFHGIGPTGLHRSTLLAQARYLVIAMVNLPLFDGDPEAIDDDKLDPDADLNPDL